MPVPNAGYVYTDMSFPKRADDDSVEFYGVSASANYTSALNLIALSELAINANMLPFLPQIH